MTNESWLPPGGENLFQGAKRMRSEAESKGIKIINLAIGQPQGPALLSARKAAAEAVMSDQESMHEYQDNGSPGVPGFANRFVLAQVPSMEKHLYGLEFLPIPGIKSMLGLIPLACGLRGLSNARVLTTTKPGYPTPADWTKYLGITTQPAFLTPENEFRFDPNRTGNYIKLVMMNYPHNPTGQIATLDWLEDICNYCEGKEIRIFNDAAYYGLSNNPSSACLSQVAWSHPNLSWAEAFSASKIIGNGTGWRVGAIVGSKDFVDDIAKIKGNTDSGFAAPLAAGALHAVENDQAGIAQVRQMYGQRLDLLTDTLSNLNMRLAVRPGAGFFTLWKVPTFAFGEKVLTAEHFNQLMTDNTGVNGIHFDPDYIRYAVCSDVEAMLPEIDQAFEKAAVEY